MRIVAEQKHISVEEVEMLTAYDFLNWLCFAIDESNEKKRQMEEWRRKH